MHILPAEGVILVNCQQCMQQSLNCEHEYLSLLLCSFELLVTYEAVNCIFRSTLQ